MDAKKNATNFKNNKDTISNSVKLKEADTKFSDNFLNI